ncbi:cupin domain-containing protein [Aegicerativicinus sediminis]|uniref:cupin domain-containing protein n=1 Tax=Aegicerativicinus sediminis TaxID=2893202 RepID=UPI001E3C05ED|nr:cupin domain-containing protein [Aegicerativicinus sediminis]
MGKIVLKDIEPKEIIKGYHGRFIHMDTYTLGFWEVEAGAEIPIHSHVHEQTTQVIEGEFQMTVDGKTEIYTPGMIVKIPSHAPHGGKAITNCKLSDVFCPAREDYK